MHRANLKKMILSAMFLTLGFILPMFTGQIPIIGKALLPMHIPVLLCGFICGWKYGGFVGFVLPLARSLIFSVPAMYPTAIAVALEMTVYGIVTGLLYHRAPQKTIPRLYTTLILAMIAGRVMRLFAEIVLLGFAGNAFVFKTFLTGVILHSVPGIFLQLIIVPMIIVATRVGSPDFSGH